MQLLLLHLQRLVEVGLDDLHQLGVRGEVAADRVDRIAILRAESDAADPVIL